MKKWLTVLGLVLGIIIILLGSILLQTTVPVREERNMMKENISLMMPGNATLYIPIGIVETGDRVEVRFAATQEVMLMVVEKGSGKAIEGMMETVMGTVFRGPYVKLAPITYNIDKSMDLVLIINIPPDATYSSTKLSYVSIYVHPPHTYPYVGIGTILIVAGIIFIIVVLLKRRK
jgi:hypothetical protein